MTEDQTLITEIGNTMWRVFPAEFKKLIFEATIYEEWPMHAYYLLDENNQKCGYVRQDPPDREMDKVMNLCKQLVQTPVFVDKPFNHVKVVLDDDRTIGLNFADIPRGDSWVGLFMRGVSQLSEKEAKQYHIPKDEWERRVRKFRRRDT